jgi:hypothetical protein
MLEGCSSRANVALVFTTEESMHITQIYETTVVDKDSDATARYVVVPRRAFGSADWLPPYAEGAEERNVATFFTLATELADAKPQMIDASHLVFAVATCLAASTPQGLDELGRLKPLDAIPEDLFRGQIRFAEILALAPVVPFENSPLGLDSLGALITRSTGVGLGAYAGFVIAGTSPLLLITVPAGMVLFGAASGVANALEQGLRERVLKLVKGRARK